jgi:phenylacetate-CoA ligase
LEPHYQIVVDREDGIDTLEVRVEISETMPEMDEMKTLEQAKARLGQKIDAVLGVKVKVTLVEPRSIARAGEGKTRRVVDNRQI